jgi:Asp-tRNA(Asn)/Glu-tRNA(Gln) amidotransferase A subunit family amidase
MNIPTATEELCQQLRSGDLSLFDYLAHLEAMFAAREPSIHAFLPETERFVRLHAEATALYARYPEPASRPALFGLPIGVKDIFHVDGFETHAGSTLPPELLAGAEADVVTNLKVAGALVLGKTVSTEFAYFAPGPTRNPHDPAHTPGGSSSGSAAAVAAGLAPLALGTQTIGSISRPAAFCGVVGYKPSYDRISRRGVIPLSPSLDHVGFFAGDVGGVQLAAAQLATNWQATTDMRKPALGIPEGPYLAHASTIGQVHFNAVCERLDAAGLVVQRVSALNDYNDIVSRHHLLMAAEAAAVHETWYAQYGDLYHPKTAALIRRGQHTTEAAIAQARRGRAKLRRELETVMDEQGIDLWLSPAAPGPAPLGLESTGDPIMNLPWTHAGLPIVSLPAGFSDQGLPLGLQLTGRWYQDEQLLRWAAADIAPALNELRGKT